MPERIELRIDGRPCVVEAGTTVASALLAHGVTAFHRSVHGEPRAPLCGMGICYECRVTIDGVPHCRSCQILCRSGMEVQTGAGQP